MAAAALAMVGAAAAAHVAGFVDLAPLWRAAGEAASDGTGEESATIAAEEDTAAPAPAAAAEGDTSAAGSATAIGGADASEADADTGEATPPLTMPSTTDSGVQPNRSAPVDAGPIVPPVKRVSPKTPPLPGEEKKKSSAKKPADSAAKKKPAADAKN